MADKAISVEGGVTNPVLRAEADGREEPARVFSKLERFYGDVAEVHEHLQHVQQGTTEVKRHPMEQVYADANVARYGIDNMVRTTQGIVSARPRTMELKDRHAAEASRLHSLRRDEQAEQGTPGQLRRIHDRLAVLIQDKQASLLRCADILRAGARGLEETSTVLTANHSAEGEGDSSAPAPAAGHTQDSVKMEDD